MIHQFVLSGEVLEISQNECNDVVVTHRALQTVAQHSGVGALIDVGDCGAAYRFMMALLSVTPGRWRLTGTPRLLQRPMEELASVLTAAGAALYRDTAGWHIEGRALTAETLTIDCTRSSQFASALLLIAPKIGLRTLHVTPATFGSVPYVQLTRLCAKSEVAMPELPPAGDSLGRVGDWSAALFWYAHAALHPAHACELLDLSLASAQGDSIIAEWFDALGVTSLETDRGVLIQATRPPQARPYLFDVADHLDVVPVMAALAALLPADFTFLHTRNLSYKESDRARLLAEQLSPFAEVDWRDESLRIIGRPRAQWPSAPYRFATNRDHRLAMAFLLFGDNAVLDDTDCLKKSYPELIQQSYVR